MASSRKSLAIPVFTTVAAKLIELLVTPTSDARLPLPLQSAAAASMLFEPAPAGFLPPAAVAPAPLPAAPASPAAAALRPLVDVPPLAPASAHTPTTQAPHGRS